MRVLIFEHSISGHFLAYVRLLIDAAAPIAREVIVAAREGIRDSPEYQAHLAPVQASFILDDSLPPLRPSPMAMAFGRPLLIRRSIRKHHPDHLWIPYADGVTQITGLCSLFGIHLWPQSLPSSALLMRGKYAYPPLNWPDRLQAKLSYHLTRFSPWTRIFCIDPVQYAYIQEHGGALARRVFGMPDPVPSTGVKHDKSDARKDLHLPDGGRYIGCFGALDERKGIDLLLRAFDAAQLRPDDRVLLMGKTSVGVQNILSTDFADKVRERKIILVDRYVAEEELAKGISACDLICTPYPRHIGSASIVIRAAAAGRPVLASEFGWMRHAVPLHELGWLCDVTNLPLFATVLTHTLSLSESFHPSEAMLAFAKGNTPGPFVQQWARTLTGNGGSVEP